MKTTSIRHYLLISCLVGTTIAVPTEKTPETKINRGRSSEKQNCNECSPCEQKILESINNTNNSFKTCCTTLGNSISNVEDTINTCCTNLTNDIENVNNNLTTCCDTLESMIGNIGGCGTITTITQKDIPFEITKSGRYCLGQDISVNTPGQIGIAVNAVGVDLNLNGHAGKAGAADTTVIATIGTASLVHIHNGVVTGSDNSADVGQIGIAALTNNVVISSIQAQKFSAPESSGFLIQGLANSKTEAISVKHCTCTGNFIGIEINNSSNLKIHDCALDKSIFAGIAQVNAPNSSSNILVEDCAISNSTNHGISTAVSQSNWIFKNVQINASGLNGMNLAGGFQSLAIKNCQVLNSGVYGITLSSNQSQNVEINDSQSDAVLIESVNNLLIQNSQFTNTSSANKPTLAVQNSSNGSIRGCLLSSTSSDGFFTSNCKGLSVQNCDANIQCSQPVASCPIGFNLNSGLSNVALEQCTVSGTPSIGIAVGLTSTANNTGILIDRCAVQGAGTGIFLAGTTSSTVTYCNVVNCSGDGIALDPSATLIIVVGNYVTHNGGTGINLLTATMLQKSTTRPTALASRLSVPGATVSQPVTCPSSIVLKNIALCNGVNYSDNVGNVVVYSNNLVGVSSLVNVSGVVVV